MTPWRPFPTLSAFGFTPTKFISQQEKHSIRKPFAPLEEFQTALDIRVPSALDVARLDTPGGGGSDADDVGEVRPPIAFVILLEQ